MHDGSTVSTAEILKEAKASSKAGNLDTAETLFNSVLAEDPRNPAAKKGLERIRTRRRKKARKAGANGPGGAQAKAAPAGTDPSQQEIKRLLALHGSGQPEKAEATARELIAAYPQSLGLYDVLHAAQMAQRKYDEAIDTCCRALAIKPDDAGACCNLGSALAAQGRYEEAAKSYRKAIGFKPDFAKAYSNLGAALLHLEKLDVAAACCRKAVDLEPGNAGVHHNLAIVLQEYDQPDEAIESFEKTLELKPDFALAYKDMAVLYERINELEKAQEYAELARERLPENPSVHYVMAVLKRRAGDIEGAIQTLLPYTDARATMVTRVNIHNELGKLYDRQKDSEKAFHHFAAGNRLQIESTPDLEDLKEHYRSELDAVTNTLTPEWYASWEPFEAAEEARPPAFLVGFPRSGTTLLDQILDSHPAIQVMEEKSALPDTQRAFAQKFHGYPASMAQIGADEAAEFRALYFKNVAKFVDLRPGALLVDKFPLNIAYAPLIVRLFPNAPIIFALRHPCDVVLSNFMQHFKINKAMANFLTLPDAAHTYNAVMTLWQKCTAVLPVNYHTVKYETLVVDFESEVRQVLEFLGVGWDESVLDYSDHARSRTMINTPSYQAVTEPINQKARFRWKRYEDKFAPVMDELAPFIEAFGY